MTRRIAISILLTVWVVLLFAGVLAYLVTRSVLVADLDATLLARIASLPGIERPGSFSGPRAAVDSRDDFIIKNARGQTVERPSATDGSAIPELQVVSRAFTKLGDGSRIRTLTVKAYARRESPDSPLSPVSVTYRGSADHLDALLSRLAWMLGIYGVVAGLATAAVAVIVARNALAPLRSTTQTIGEISERNLDRRIPVDKLPPELVPVGQRLNEMLSRLQRAFVQRKQFLADASHELRTPVAALVTTLEVTLHKTRTPQEYQRALETCLADSRVLHQLVASLMDQVRDEHFAKGQSADLSPVRISAVLDHCSEIAAALGTDKGIQIERRWPDALVGISDELKLRSIATNLLSNAVEYTPAGGHVRIEVEVLPANPSAAGLPSPPESVAATLRLWRLTVSDNGPGIAAEHLRHLFEPFYRADKVRSQAQHHLGLGLFLVREHVRSLSGECRVISPAEFPGFPGGPGSAFVVELPMFIVAPQDDALPARPHPGAAPLLMKD